MVWMIVFLVAGILLLALAVAIGVVAFVGHDAPVENRVPLDDLLTERQ